MPEACGLCAATLVARLSSEVFGLGNASPVSPATAAAPDSLLHAAAIDVGEQVQPLSILVLDAALRVQLREFSDSAHFSRCFRATYGCTACDFRMSGAPMRRSGR